jgi:hypothetical protein
MIVYVALKQNAASSHILGIFSSKNSAVACCLKQPTYTRQTWQEDQEDAWHNGHGMYVKVVNYSVQ